MEEPDNCPEKLYDLMRRCWQHKPSLRPSFLDLVSYSDSTENSVSSEIQQDSVSVSNPSPSVIRNRW